MSKRLKSKPATDDVATTRALTLGAKAAIDTLLEWVAHPIPENTSSALFHGLRQWAEQDISHFNQSLHAGQAFKMFLALDIDVQKQFVHAMADVLKMDKPSYEQVVGRPTSGKQQLAQVLYAPWEEQGIFKKSANSNETPAAQRITHAVRRFEGKEKAYRQEHPRETVAITAAGKPTTRAYKSVFQELWAILEDDHEKLTLIDFFERKGFDYVADLNKWVPANEVVLVTKNMRHQMVSARTVTASSVAS